MRFLLVAAGLALLPLSIASAEDQAGHAVGHEQSIFSMISTEIDYADRDDGLWSWGVDGWVGGDYERVWIRSEGEINGGDVESAEAQIYYGWNYNPFWDVLVGIRQDFEPAGFTYLAASIAGLSPNFFETEASLFVSNEGDLSARFEQSFDLLITQKLIAQPKIEVNLYAQDVPDLGVGAGISDFEASLQIRYEVIRKAGPYVELSWEKAVGETAAIAKADGEDPDELNLRFGVRFWF